MGEVYALTSMHSKREPDVAPPFSAISCQKFLQPPFGVLASVGTGGQMPRRCKFP